MSLDLDFLSGVRLFFFFFFLLLFWSMMVMVGLVGNGEESEASLAAFAWPLKECGARGGGRGGASLDWSVAAPEGDRSGRKSSPPPPPGGPAREPAPVRRFICSNCPGRKLSVVKQGLLTFSSSE